jgi:DNA-directed RNA polymerase specialized sigma24 family protein
MNCESGRSAPTIGRRMKPWTAEDDKIVTDMWMAGEKITVIAATIDRKDDHVRWRREFLRLPPRTRILDMAEAQSLSFLWVSGWSVSEIAKAMGVSPASINSKIKRIRRKAPELFAYRFPRQRKVA